MEKVNPVLTVREKKVIRKIAKVHIQALSRILKNEVEGEDVKLECIKEEIEEEELNDSVNETIGRFENIIRNPPEFFNVPQRDMNLSMHILMNFFEHPKYEVARRSIFRKVYLMEPIPKEVPFSLN